MWALMMTREFIELVKVSSACKKTLKTAVRYFCVSDILSGKYRIPRVKNSNRDVSIEIENQKKISFLRFRDIKTILAVIIFRFTFSLMCKYSLALTHTEITIFAHICT